MLPLFLLASLIINIINIAISNNNKNIPIIRLQIIIDFIVKEAPLVTSKPILVL